MPFSALASMAKKRGKGVAAAERYWSEGKADEHPVKGKDRGKHSYRYLMGIVKKRLGK